MPNVAFVSKFLARNALVVETYLKNTDDLEKVRIALKNLPSVQKMESTRIMTGIRTAPQNLSVLKIERYRKNIKANKTEGNKKLEKIEIDQMDKKIIERLAANGRTPFREIAKDLNASIDTIARRYERLRENNVIKVVIQIDPTKIGYRATAGITLTFSEDNVLRALEILKQTGDITLLIRVDSDKFDIFAVLMTKDIVQFTDVQEKIVNLPGLTNIDTIISKISNSFPPPRQNISTL